MSDALFNKIFEFRQQAKQMEKQAAKSKASQDFYESQNNQEVDIKDYEPNLIESENLYLPRNSKIKNYGFSDIMESIIENKYNDSQNKKFDLY